MANPEELFLCSQLPQGEKERKRRRRRGRRRRRKGEGEVEEWGLKKRKLSEDQVRFLERSFREERKLESGRKVQLATELGLDPRQVAVWFQNRRARWKTKLLEEEYAKLKSTHEDTLLNKCHLEAEILKLKEQLSLAQMDIARLSRGSGGGVVTSSPSTSISTEAHQPLLEKDMLDYYWANIWDYSWNPYGIDGMHLSCIF